MSGSRIAKGNGNKRLDELLTERSGVCAWKLRLTAVNEDERNKGGKSSPVRLQASGTVCLGNSHEGQTDSATTMFLYSRVRQYNKQYR